MNSRLNNVSLEGWDSVWKKLAKADTAHFAPRSSAAGCHSAGCQEPMNWRHSLQQALLPLLQFVNTSWKLAKWLLYSWMHAHPMPRNALLLLFLQAQCWGAQHQPFLFSTTPRLLQYQLKLTARGVILTATRKNHIPKTNSSINPLGICMQTKPIK